MQTTVFEDDEQGAERLLFLYSPSSPEFWHARQPATKTYQPQGAGLLEKTQTFPHRATMWRARYSRPFTGIRDLADGLSEAEQLSEAFRVQADLNPETCEIVQPDVGPPEAAGVINRRYKHHDDRPDPNLRELDAGGTRALFVDVDGAALPGWFDPEGFEPQADPETLRELVRFAASEYLPRELADTTLFYQWSSSAGLVEVDEDTYRPGWNELDLHFWFWLDRPAYKNSIKQWLDGREGVDSTIYKPTQPHYTAAPVFEDGATDPLGGVRSGLLEGEQDTVELPPSVVDRETYEETQRLAETSRDTRETGEAEQVDLSLDELPESYNTAEKQAAREILERECRALANKQPGGRHNYACSTTRRVFGLSAAGLLDESTVEQAFRKAARQAWSDGSDTPGEINGLVKLGKREPDALEMAERVREAAAPDDREPFDLRDGADPAELEPARRGVAETIDSAVEAGGRHAVQTDPGVGKTYAALHKTLDLFERGERVKYVLPTNGLIEDKIEELKQYAQERGCSDAQINRLDALTGSRPKREDENCHKFDLYKAASNAAKNGGMEVCNRCEFNPESDNHGGETCDFWRNRYRFGEPQIVFSTFDLEMRTRGAGDERRQFEIGWSEIRDTIAGTAYERREFRPVVKVTRNNMRLTLEVARQAGEYTGTLPEPLISEAGGSGMLGGGRIHVDPDHRAFESMMLRWFGDRLDVPAIENPVKQAYREAEELHDHEFDTVFIDDCSVNELLPTAEAAKGELETWGRNDDLEFESDDRGDQFFRLLRTARDGTGTAALAECLPSGSFTVADNTTGSREIREALAGSEAEAVDRLNKAPSADVLHSLESVAASGWQGAKIVRNDNNEAELSITKPREFDCEQARSLVYLDATGDPYSAQCILPGCEYHSIPVELPDGVDVYQTRDWSASKTGGWRFERSAARFRALFSALDGDGTLWVVPKAWRKDENGELHGGFSGAERCAEFEPLHAADDSGRVIHFGGTQARGSNEFSEFERVVVGAFYVPKARREQLAEAMRLRLDDPADAERIERAAAFQLQGAETLQALHRVRPVLSDELEIVLLDDRSYPSLGESREFSADVAASVAGGAEPRGRYCAAACLHAAGILGGGAFIPSKGVQAECTDVLAPAASMGTFADLEAAGRSIASQVLEAGELEQLGTYLRDVCKNHFNGNWGEFADAAGLEAVTVRVGTSENATSAAAVYNPDAFGGSLSPEAVAARGIEGARWIEVDGDRVNVGDSEVWQALDECEPGTLAELAGGGGNAKTILADLLDCSETTAHRRIADLGGTSELRELARHVKNSSSQAAE